MKIMLMKMMMVIPASTVMLSTPMSMGVLLLILTTTSTVLVAQTLTTAWLPMIMFLMLVGGLLILFMYMSSIASNEKFTTNMFMAIIALIAAMVPLEGFMVEFITNDITLSTMSVDMISMTKIYNKKTFIITMFMFLYLLMTMIVVTKIIKIFKGPLRAK
uniref:NADH dehydrogenase subunit 6 n=1 Tax=Nesophrosyne maritima TaxID=1223861 RepID=UPI0021821513|nr:NADH dehydrogenase subunit 6 [Nesophrosyne maritima]UVI59852.1 NADH dehydrogenase subunit 6 [Nesophrosyne maritima]